MASISKGDIYLVELGNNMGSVQSGKRPAIIVSNNLNNKFSTTVNVIPLTSADKSKIPVHVDVDTTSGVRVPSVALTEQITTVNKTQLQKRVGVCDITTLNSVDNAIKKQFAFAN